MCTSPGAVVQVLCGLSGELRRSMGHIIKALSVSGGFIPFSSLLFRQVGRAGLALQRQFGTGLVLSLLPGVWAGHQDVRWLLTSSLALQSVLEICHPHCSLEGQGDSSKPRLLVLSWG